MAHLTGNPKHVPVAITADTSRLSDDDLETLQILIQATKAADRVYLEQMRQFPLAPGAVFVPVPDANYPAGATKADIDAFLEKHPDMRNYILDPFTVVTKEDGCFASILFTEAYAAACAELSDLLNLAGSRVEYPNMKQFLLARAEAFRTNQYRESDILWIHANDAPFELIIGPYESYADKLFGVKRTFEAILGLVCPEETAYAHSFQEHIVLFDEYLGHLYGYESSPTTTPMVVIDEITSAGEALYDYIAMACNLPNDVDIHQEVGSKKVFMRNVMKAKFEVMTYPIAERVLDPSLLSYVDSAAFLQFVIGHEAAHGLSFHFTGEDFGTDHSALEEGKADVFGLLFLSYLQRTGVLTLFEFEKAVISHFTDCIRQVRFGIDEAHAVGALIQLNWMADEGALTLSERRLGFQPHTFRTALEQLGKAFYTVAASKDLSIAKDFIQDWGGVPQELRTILDVLGDLPIDIDPQFEY